MDSWEALHQRWADYREQQWQRLEALCSNKRINSPSESLSSASTSNLFIMGDRGFNPELLVKAMAKCDRILEICNRMTTRIDAMIAIPSRIEPPSLPDLSLAPSSPFLSPTLSRSATASMPVTESSPLQVKDRVILPKNRLQAPPSLMAGLLQLQQPPASTVSIPNPTLLQEPRGQPETAAGLLPTPPIPTVSVLPSCLPFLQQIPPRPSQSWISRSVKPSFSLSLLSLSPPPEKDSLLLPKSISQHPSDVLGKKAQRVTQNEKSLWQATARTGGYVARDKEADDDNPSFALSSCRTGIPLGLFHQSGNQCHKPHLRQLRFRRLCRPWVLNHPSSQSPVAQSPSSLSPPCQTLCCWFRRHIIHHQLPYHSPMLPRRLQPPWLHQRVKAFRNPHRRHPHCLLQWRRSCRPLFLPSRRSGRHHSSPHLRCHCFWRQPPRSSSNVLVDSSCCSHFCCFFHATKYFCFLSGFYPVIHYSVPFLLTIFWSLEVKLTPAFDPPIPRPPPWPPPLQRGSYHPI